VKGYEVRYKAGNRMKEDNRLIRFKIESNDDNLVLELYASKSIKYCVDNQYLFSPRFPIFDLLEFL